VPFTDVLQERLNGNEKAFNTSGGRLERSVDGLTLSVTCEWMEKSMASLKADVGAVEKSLKADMGSVEKVMVSALNEKMGAVEKSLKADVGAVKESLKADVGAVEKSLKAEISSLNYTLRTLLEGLLLVVIFRPLAEPLVKKGSEIVAKTLD
jgi:hypothetical protein